MDFLAFKALFSPKESYHTNDSKLMLQLAEDRAGYSIPAVRFIEQRIKTFEMTGYPPLGIY